MFPLIISAIELDVYLFCLTISPNTDFHGDLTQVP